MEFLAEILIRDGVSSVLIVVLAFIWRDINRISKKVEGFNARLYHSDGSAIYQSVKECDDQMNVCRKDLNNLGMKVHKNTNDIMRMEIRFNALAERIEKNLKL